MEDDRTANRRAADNTLSMVTPLIDSIYSPRQRVVPMCLVAGVYALFDIADAIRETK